MRFLSNRFNHPSQDLSALSAMAAESITDLAAIISENTAKVHNYYSSNGLTLPSFDVEAPTESLISTEAKEAQDARVAVIEATKKLRNYMLGPRDFLLSDFQVCSALVQKH